MVGDFWHRGMPPAALRDTGLAQAACDIVEIAPERKAPASDDASERWLVFVDGPAGNRALPNLNIETDRPPAP